MNYPVLRKSVISASEFFENYINVSDEERGKLYNQAKKVIDDMNIALCRVEVSESQSSQTVPVQPNVWELTSSGYVIMPLQKYNELVGVKS